MVPTMTWVGLDVHARSVQGAVVDSRTGELWRRSRLRQCKYLNNIVEQDHRPHQAIGPTRARLRQLPDGSTNTGWF